MKSRTIAHLYALTVILFGLGLSSLTSRAIREDELNAVIIFYWYMLPAIPFIFLGFFAILRGRHFSLAPFLGATDGCFGCDWGALWLNMACIGKIHRRGSEHRARVAFIGVSSLFAVGNV